MSRRLLATALLAVMCAVSSAQESPYDVFDLGVEKAGGITIHYERPLERKMPEIVRRVEAFMTQTAWRREAGTRGVPSPEAVADDVLKITGAGNEHAREALVQILAAYGAENPFTMASAPGFHLYIITADSVKEHLRSGGSLPGMSYDSATDECTYLLKFGVQLSDGSTPGVQTHASAALAVPVSGLAAAPSEVVEMLKSFADPGIGVHEAVEAASVLRLQRQDRQMRWFYEGMADAVSSRLVEKHFGKAARQRFDETWNVKEYDALKTEVNLLYWPPEHLAVMTPLASEASLFDARYSFATVEAAHILDAYGEDAVRKIFDEAAVSGPATPEGLFKAIKDVTGEDMRERLKAYQPFDTQAEGFKHYASAARAARERGDLEAALVATVRALELSDDCPPALLDQAARLMHGLGRTDFADQFYDRQLHDLGHGSAKGLLEEMQRRFVEYAVDTGRPEKAWSVAQSVLAKDDDNPTALAVSAHQLAAKGDAEEALLAAERVLECASVNARIANYANRLLETGGRPVPFVDRAAEPALEATDTL